MNKRRKWLKYLPLALGIVVVIAAVGLAFFLKSIFFKENVEQKKMVQQITVIAPPPPPPPPPPEQMEEPEIEEEVLEEDIEEAMPDEGMDEAPGEELGLDAEGSAGADGFGLKAKKGGRGLLGAGGYENTIHAEIQKLIIRDKRLNGLIYEADVRIWVSDDGSFERFTISLLEDDEDVERELNRFFASIAGINKPKPLQEQDNKWFDFRFKSSSSL